MAIPGNTTSHHMARFERAPFRIEPQLADGGGGPKPRKERPLSTRAMLDFYIPLSLTQLLVILASPIGSAAMSRMPLALVSLAAWPVVSGINFIVRGFGGAYNEVVVALIEEQRAMRALRRFAVVLCLVGTVALLILMIPAVAEAIFEDLLHQRETLALVHR